MEREVKAKLDVERTGDRSAFADLAADIESAADRSRPFDERVQAMADGLRRLADIVGESDQAITAHFRSIATAAQELAEAEGIDQQRAALERLEQTWRGLTDLVERTAGASSKSLASVATGLREITKLRSEIDPLRDATVKVADAFEELDQKVEKGGRGAERALTQARQALDQYRQELDRAKQSGATFSTEQARLLEDLEREYDEATESLVAYKRAQRSVRSEVDEGSKSLGSQKSEINSLQDLLEASLPRWAKFTTAAFAAFEALGTGIEIGNQLRETLNHLTDDGFDRVVQKWLGFGKLAEVLAQGQEDAGLAASVLTNRMNILARNGIDVAGKSVEEINRLWEEYRGKTEAANLETHKAFQAGRLLAKELGVTEEALEKATVRLVEFVQQAQQGSFDDAALRDRLKPSIQQVLDLFALMGKQAPASLQAIADAWEITTTTAERAAQRHQQLVSQILQDITGIQQRSREELLAEAKALTEALANIDPSVEFLDPDQFDRAKAKIRELLDLFEAMGAQVPESLVQQADAFRAWQNAYERASTVARSSAAAVSEGHVRIEESAGSATKRITNLGEAASGAASKLAEQADSTLHLQQATEGSRASITNLSTDADRLEASLSGVQQASDQTADSVGQGAAKVQEGAAALQAAAPAAADAGAKLRQAASGSDELASAQDRAQSSLAATRSEVDGIREALQSLDPVVDQVVGGIREKLASLSGVAEPLIQEVQAAIAAMREAARASEDLAA